MHAKLALCLSVKIKSTQSRQSNSMYYSQDYFVFFLTCFSVVSQAVIKEVTLGHSWYLVGPDQYGIFAARKMH